MMFCPYCGQSLRDGARFCSACGMHMPEEEPEAEDSADLSAEEEHVSETEPETESETELESQPEPEPVSEEEKTAVSDSASKRKIPAYVPAVAVGIAALAVVGALVAFGPLSPSAGGPGTDAALSATGEGQQQEADLLVKATLADGYTDGSTPVVAHVRASDGTDIYALLTVTQNVAQGVVRVPVGDCEISFVSPVNPDGSMYDVSQTVKVEVPEPTQPAADESSSGDASGSSAASLAATAEATLDIVPAADVTADQIQATVDGLNAAQEALSAESQSDAPANDTASSAATSVGDASSSADDPEAILGAAAATAQAAHGSKVVLEDAIAKAEQDGLQVVSGTIKSLTTDELRAYDKQTTWDDTPDYQISEGIWNGWFDSKAHLYLVLDTQDPIRSTMLDYEGNPFELNYTTPYIILNTMNGEGLDGWAPYCGGIDWYPYEGCHVVLALNSDCVYTGQDYVPVSLGGAPWGNAAGFDFSDPNQVACDGCRLLAADPAVPADVLPAPKTYLGFNMHDEIDVAEDGTLTWRHYDYMGGQMIAATNADFTGKLVRTDALGMPGAAIYELQYDVSACGKDADTSKKLYFIYNPNNGFFGLIDLDDSGAISGIDRLPATS